MAEMNPKATPALLPGVVGNWRLEPDATTISLSTKAVWGLARVKGTLKAVGGSGTVGEDGLAGGRVIIDARSIDTHNKKRDLHLRSDEFFAVERYPTFSFVTDGKIKARNGILSVAGELTIREISRPATFETRIVELSSSRLVVQSEAEMDRTQWNMTWAKMGAAVTNRVVVVATFIRE